MSSTDRAFVIGDVHGCYDELMRLLDKAGASLSRQRIVFVGDLINKGPESYKVLQFVRDQGLDCTIGNHELKFLKSTGTPESLPPRLKELKVQMKSDLNLWLGWIDSLPSFIETEHYFVVHGGFHPRTAPHTTPREILATIRTWKGNDAILYQPEDPAWHTYYQGTKSVFYGHWAIQGLHFENNTYGLDSGCVYGRHLTGIWADSKDYVQVPAKKAYCSFR